MNTPIIEKKILINGYDDFIIPNLDDSIIICGEVQKDEAFNRILDLSKHLNAPIFADPTSNIRYYQKHQNIISNYNLFLDEINLGLALPCLYQPEFY